MNNTEIIQSLNGQSCLCASIHVHKMAFNAPQFEQVIFNSDWVLSWMEEDTNSDFGCEISVQEIGNQIIITVTDGDSEPTNEIYIFNK